jgi:hypothetical protein
LHPRESHRLRPGTPVWVWVVRLAKGRWWPGTVEGLRSVEGRLRFAVRFECRSASAKDKTPVMVGITTTAMRYLELRNIDGKGIDQPAYAPVSLLECPEELEESESETAASILSRFSTVEPGTNTVASTSNRTNGNLSGK